MSHRLLSALAALFLSCATGSAKAVPPPRPRLHVAAMAPLTVGDLEAPDDPAHSREWEQFDRDLAQARALGIGAISLNLWWGVIERIGDQQFNFRWADKAIAAITRAGLQARPVIAF